MMNFLDLITIKHLILTVSDANVLDNHSKDLLTKANNGLVWNCQHGCLDVVQWLCSVDIHIDNDHIFKLACQNGQLNIAQWIYSPVIHQNTCEDVFEWACQNGHLIVAQWIYSLGKINIQHHRYAMTFIILYKTYNSDATKQANKLMLEWLNSL